MQSAFYVTLSAQVSVDKRMETIANNIANAPTAGYRAGGVTFEQIVSDAGSTHVAYVSAGTDYISRANGELSKTDNPLDIGIVGKAFLAVRTPQGTAYTRDGRLQMNEAGDLRTVTGYPVLDAGNSPIVLDPNGGPPKIARDGMITQAGQQVGAIGLFTIDDDAALSRGPGASVMSMKASPVLDFVRNGVEQGFVEGSNVNPVLEMARLVSTSRAFESITAMNDMLDSTQKDAIRTLGGA